MKYVMALDQGTTSSRCIIFDRRGSVKACVQKEFRQIFPKPGWVEHDAEEIWDTTLEVSRAAMAKLGVSAHDIAAIGITNQRETTVVWDRETGRPIAHAIVWQCRRTAGMVDELVRCGLGESIRLKTGLHPDAYFSGTKLKWLLDNVPEARKHAEEGRLLFGTIDTWLIWKLTGGKAHVTDYTNASRTMLFNIRRLDWDGELLSALDIPVGMLPEVKPSSCVYGLTESGLYGGEIPISGAAGDQQSALFGQCCFEPGQIKNTYGTGCFLLMNTGTNLVQSKNGLISTIAASADGKARYALEGSVFSGGAVIQWLRDELGLISAASESEVYASTVPDASGGYIVPAFTGLGAPYWSQDARGIIVGLTRGFSRAHLVRSALESLAYQTYDLVKAMELDSGHRISELKADGGASANDFLMQFQADILCADVCRPACIETTALGAAYLAGLAVGYWSGLDEMKNNREAEEAFKPSMPEQCRSELLGGWRRAVSCALKWAELSGA